MQPDGVTFGHLVSVVRVFTMKPIGVVRSPRTDVVDDRWGDVVATIELSPQELEPSATDGLAEFSHLEVVFLFDRVTDAMIVRGARHPRDNPDWPVAGVLAQRGKNRPNRLGVSRCELVAVEGLTLTVRALDAIDGTPVLDIKPYLVEFAPRGDVRQPAWSAELMSAYYSS